MDDDKKLLMERLERLAIVLDELMPGCAELVRDALAMLKEQAGEISRMTNEYLNLVKVASKKPDIVRCKNCKHRPKEPNLKTYESGFDIEFPEGSKCPCQCSGDESYSWYPEDDWFCADGERREYVKPVTGSATDWDGVECE